MTESWFNDAVRGLCAAIDRAVFSLISIVYEILQQISRVSVFSTDSIREFSIKIYTLLGLIMLFKVAFSFITYIVNPDQINDKAKGAHKIVLNVLLVLVMIIITPTAFDKLYKVQSAILREQLIPKFVLGTEGDMGIERYYLMSDKCSSNNMAMAESDGDFLSILIFRPFFQPETDDVSDLNTYCSIGTDIGNLGTVSKYLVGNIYNSAPDFWNGTYIIDYKFFLASLVGIVVLLILVSFCFDVAVRALKLAFLQIIAPVPIISYVDPNSGKNGIFSKWLKEVGKTWADLFVRLLALFFAVYVIGVLVSQESLATIDGEAIQYKFWVDLLLIIGALIFAKQLPKLLENILGIKINGGLTLNPMKKIRDQALGGKAVTGVMKGGVALAAGVGVGAAANIAAMRATAKKDGDLKTFGEEDAGFFRKARYYAGTAIGGSVSSGIHGAHGAYKNDSLKKGIIPGVKKSVDNRDKRGKEKAEDYKFSTKVMDKFRGIAGIKTEAKIRSEQAQSKVENDQATLNSISYQQQNYVGELSSENINNLNSISKEVVGQKTVIDENGKATIEDIIKYSLKDATGNKIDVGNWTDSEFKKALDENSADIVKHFGEISGDTDKIMKWINLQAQRNDVSSNMLKHMKTQKLFTEKDAEANKKT